MTLFGGKLGFLALTISLMVYMALSATAFVKIPNLGPTPMIPTNTTGIQKTATKYKFNLEMELYMIHQKIDKALKQHLLGVMENIYVRYLKKKYIKYGNHTRLEVSDHLKAN